MKQAAYAAARIIGMANVQALERAGIVLSFGDAPPADPQMPSELQTILMRTAEIFDVPIRSLIGQTRVSRVVEARQAAIVVARQRTSLSLVELGRQLGGRDHTTVMYSIEASERRAKINPHYATKLAMLQGAL